MSRKRKAGAGRGAGGRPRPICRARSARPTSEIRPTRRSAARGAHGPPGRSAARGAHGPPRAIRRARSARPTWRNAARGAHGPPRRSGPPGRTGRARSARPTSEIRPSDFCAFCAFLRPTLRLRFGTARLRCKRLIRSVAQEEDRGRSEIGIRSVTPSAHLLPPLCPSSVASVTQSSSDFCAFCAFLRPTFQTLSPRITRIARIKNQAPFPLFPPVKSVLPPSVSFLLCVRAPWPL
jgi:hypothetical protein